MHLIRVLIFILISNIVLSEDFIYSGFSLQGKFSHNEINYPMFSKFLKEDNEINKKLFQIMQNEKGLIIQKSSDDKGLVVSFGLLTENMNLTIINNTIKNEFILYPQVFIYDNDSKNFLGSKSARLSFMTKSSLENTNHDQSLFNAYKSLILDSEPKISFIDDCTERQIIKTSFLNIYKILFNCINLKEEEKFNIQIRNINFDNTNLIEFFSHNNDKSLSKEAITYKLANIATNATSEKTNSNYFIVLPYSKEQSIARVQNRFSDTKNLNIKLPESDFSIDIKFKGLLKKLLKEDLDQDMYGYGLGLNYKVIEPYSNTTIFEGDFKYFKPQIFPKDKSGNSNLHSSQSDSYFYLQIYEELLAKISSHILKEELSRDDKEFLKKWSNNQDSYNKIVQNHKKIVETFF